LPITIPVNRRVWGLSRCLTEKKRERGIKMEIKKPEGLPVLKVEDGIIHESAIHVEWPSGHWVNFDEFGSEFAQSLCMNASAIAEAQKLLPDMEEVRKKRRDFRNLFIKEAEQAQTDERVRKPTKKHSTSASSHRRMTQMTQEMSSLGYQTSKIWSAYCRQNGCDTYEWLIFPHPKVVAEAKRLNNLKNIEEQTI